MGRFAWALRILASQKTVGGKLVAALQAL